MIAPIFVVGFVILGVYKSIELFVKRKERILLIEKLPIIINNKEDLTSIDLSNIFFGCQNYSWALRISLLLVGIGLGCIVSFFLQVMVLPNLSENYNFTMLIDLAVLSTIACITFFGGIGLFVAYMIELKRLKGK